MRIIAIEELTDDMVLARPVYLNIGTVLLSEGATNLLRYKVKFQQLGFQYLYVEDAVSSGITIDDVVSDKMRLDGQKIAGEVLSALSANKSINIGDLKKWVEELIGEIFSNKSIVVNLMDLKSRDAFLYHHSVNVAVLSMIIGKSFQYTQKQLIYLGAGAILHDIGMLALPKQLLLKEESDLTEEERKIYCTHPQLGYEILKSNREIDAFSKLIVWRHHEQVNGGGYPTGVSGDDLHEMVRIVSVCDAYDELTSLRKKGIKMPSYQAIEYLIANIGVKFEKKVMTHFLRYIPIFPIGSTVILNDKRRAIVEKQNENFPTRPVVRIADESGRTVDLLTEVNVVISGFA